MTIPEWLSPEDQGRLRAIEERHQAELAAIAREVDRLHSELWAKMSRRARRKWLAAQERRLLR